MNVKTAIYPGTFDPVTNGHLDIIVRASEIFDEIIIAVASDSQKKTLFSIEERVALLNVVTKDIKGVSVKGFEGLTIELARQCGAKAIIRGLRVAGDFEYELQLALMNKKLAPDIETVFLMTKSDYSYISSSAIRWAASLKANISEFVPPHVEKALLERYPRD